jgi:hypothetical protein
VGRTVTSVIEAALLAHGAGEASSVPVGIVVEAGGLGRYQR